MDTSPKVPEPDPDEVVESKLDSDPVEEPDGNLEVEYFLTVLIAASEVEKLEDSLSESLEVPEKAA